MSFDTASRGGAERARVAGASAIVAACAAALFAWTAPPWPDGWDGLGFLSSIARFDLASFSPHPPGYPVYVVLLKAAALVWPRPMAAATVVAAVSGAAALAAFGAALRRLVPTSRGALPSLVLLPFAIGLCPLFFRTATAVGSEAPALAFVALAAWGLAARTPRGATFAGAMIGLLLGARASWGPLALGLLLLAPHGVRRRAWLSAAVATAVWAVPFVAVVGPHELVRLSRVHLVGHASRWGGTALTEPARARYLLRDVFVDGFGADLDLTGLCLAVVGLVAAVLALFAWRRRSFRGAKAAAIALTPYLAWIAVGQNVRQEPRHALPLVVALALGLVFAAVVDRRARVAVVALFTLAGTRTALDETARHRTPPTGEQLVQWVRAQPREVAVFGGASMRFFEGTDLASHARAVAGIGDALLAVDRLDHLPAQIVVTDELADLADSPYPLLPVAAMTRPARIDRKAPVLIAYEVLAPFLPAR